MNEILTDVEDAWSVRDNVNQVSEEAVQRVQAQSKQAKKIAQDIKKDKAINNQLANFLWYLMKTIDDEDMIKSINDTFFKITDTRNQVTYLRKDINSYVFVGFFAPFFREKIEEYKLAHFYETLWAKDAWKDLNSYTAYLWEISEKYHDNIPIDQWPLITLIIQIAKKWIYSWKEALNTEELKQKTLIALYGSAE